MQDVAEFTIHFIMVLNIVTQEDIEKLSNKIDLLINQRPTGKEHDQCYYSIKELAERLKVSTKTINNWRDQRLIEYCKVHNTIFFSESAVEDFIKNHSIKRKIQ